MLTDSPTKEPGGTDPLRHVVPMANDGFTVFAVPDTLRTALADAGRGRLRVTAVGWAASSGGDEEISPDGAVELLERLSVLASSGIERNLTLYCWYFAP